MQPVEVMQKAIDVAAVAEKYVVAGDMDGASVLVDMANMYVAMARELRIGNHRMTRPTRGTLTPVYQDTLIRKTVAWDAPEPLPTPEPFGGPFSVPTAVEETEGASPSPGDLGHPGAQPEAPEAQGGPQEPPLADIGEPAAPEEPGTAEDSNRS